MQFFNILYEHHILARPNSISNLYTRVQMSVQLSMYLNYKSSITKSLTEDQLIDLKKADYVYKWSKHFVGWKIFGEKNSPKYRHQML